MPIPQPLRAVTIELSQSHPSEVDPGHTAEFFAERGFNTLVVFALGYLRGETYYPSRYAAAHPELGGRDLFGEFIEAASVHGLSVVGYVNGFFGGPETYEQYPEWTQRWADGRETTQGAAKAICPNSPYGELVANIAGEVSNRYPVDGIYLDEPSLQSWCACRFCQERYAQDTGEDLPLEVSKGTPDFDRFLSWRTRVVTEFVAGVGQSVKDARPEASFFAQHAFPLASTAHDHLKHLFWGKTSGRTPPQFDGWYRPAFYGQHISQVAQHLDVVGIEPWRRFNGQPLWWQGACVSYARSAGRGKPVVPLMEYPHFPWGLGRLSDDELETNCVDVIANGGELWWPMYAPGSADMSGWDTIEQIFADTAGIRPSGAEQIAYLGVLVSRTSAERYAAGDADTLYLDDLLGTVQLARETHLPYRLVSAEAMDDSEIADLSVILAPSAACMSESETETLARWVRDGGHLIATGECATHDEAAQRRPASLMEEVLGVSIRAERVHAGLGYLQDRSDRDHTSLVPVRDEQPAIEVLTAEVIMSLVPSWDLFQPPAIEERHPGVTRNTYGKGIADYIGVQLGRLRKRFELFEAHQIIEMLIDRSLSPIAGVTVAPEVALHVWRTSTDMRVLLVNITSVDTTGRRTVVGRQTIRLSTEVSTISSLRGSEVGVEAEGGDVTATIDRLDGWECLVVQ
jgi:hypothetical protein